MRASTAALLLLVAYAGGGAHAAEPASCALQTLGTLDLSVDRQIFVPVTLQDRKVWMVLDTAAAFTVISKSAASDLKLRPTAFSPDIAQVGGKPVTQLVSSVRLMVGNAHVPKQQFLVNPIERAPLTVQGSPVAGVLGMDALWPFDFELDLAHRKLTLYSQDHCPGNVVYWTEHYTKLPMELGELGNIHFPVELNDRKIEATLSTGQERTTLSSDAARKLFGFDLHSPGVEVGTDADGRRAVFVNAMKLTSGLEPIMDTRVRLISPGTMCKLSTAGGPDVAVSFDYCFGRYPVVLGRAVLEKLRLYFATKEQQIYFTAADATPGH